MMENRELKALISLLDDPDDSIYTQIKSKILSLGVNIIPALENMWEHTFNPLLQNRIEQIIHVIQFQKTAEDLREWSKSDAKNLFTGALIIAAYQYPDLDLSKCHKQLDIIKQDIWLELNNHLTALEKTKVINHILFDVHSFTGNTTNFHDPQHNYLNIVLERKKGNPISMGILYAGLAQALELPIAGVLLPEHFVLAYRDLHSGLESRQPAEDRVFFYINPFSKGSVFSRKEIDAFLKQLGKAPEPSYYLPCNNLEIIRTLILNLQKSYKHSGNLGKVEELNSLLLCCQ